MRPKWSRRRLLVRRSADHQRNTLIEFDVPFLLNERTGIYVIRAWPGLRLGCAVSNPLLVRRAPDTPRLRRQPV